MYLDALACHQFLPSRSLKSLSVFLTQQRVPLKMTHSAGKVFVQVFPLFSYVLA